MRLNLSVNKSEKECNYNCVVQGSTVYNKYTFFENRTQS